MALPATASLSGKNDKMQNSQATLYGATLSRVVILLGSFFARGIISQLATYAALVVIILFDDVYCCQQSLNRWHRK